MAMKASLSFIFLLAFVSVSSRPLSKDEIIAVCSKEYPVGDSSFFDYFKQKGEIPNEEDKNAKCMFHCFPKMMGATDESGTIDVDKIMPMMMEKYAGMSDVNIRELLNKCDDKSDESDRCEKWYQFTKCHMKSYLKLAGSGK